MFICQGFFFFLLIFIKINKSICFHVYHIKSFYSFTSLLLPEVRTLCKSPLGTFAPFPVSSPGTVQYLEMAGQVLGSCLPSVGFSTLVLFCVVPGGTGETSFQCERVSVLVSEGKKEEPQRFCSCSEKVLNTPCLTSLKQRPSDSEHQPCFRQATSFSG